MISPEELPRFLAEGFERPLKEEELKKAFGVDPGEEAAFRERLYELESEGVLYRTKGGRWAPPEQLDLVVGSFQGHAKGFGFVLPTHRENGDIHIGAESRGGALHGDRVIARRLSPREGEIVRVIRRANPRIVGTLDKSGIQIFVAPDDDRLATDFVVEPGADLGAVTGDKVVLEVTHWPTDRRAPVGRVVERLGRYGDPGVDVLSIIRKFALPEGFPPEVTAAAARLPETVDPQEEASRRDFRAELVVTIDSEDAKDLDDAVSIRRFGTGWELGVHIADVTHYVPEGGPLDVEAVERGTSVYLVDRVIPMLPPKLSNGLASLNPRVDRLTLSVLMRTDAQGRIVEHEIVRGIIKTRHRLTYKHVNELLSGSAPAPGEEELLPLLAEMSALKDLRRRTRQERGSIDFELTDQKVLLDSLGQPLEILLLHRTPADEIIEEFMLAANETVAHHFAEMGIPFVYRVHPEPLPERLENLVEFLASLGYSLKWRGDLQPKALQGVLKQVEGRPEEHLVSSVLLRSLQRARYAPDNLGHFGLAAEYYTHFTSPIRRYPDLQIHRIIKEVLDAKLGPERSDHYRRVVPGVAVHSSDMERRAEEAERESVDMKKIEFMQERVGEVFSALISGVTNFGFFAELPNGVEGLVRVSTLTDDYYHFYDKGFSLIGERTHRQFRLADPVTVRVANVDKDKRRMDFELVDGGTLRPKKSMGDRDKMAAGVDKKGGHRYNKKARSKSRKTPSPS